MTDTIRERETRPSKLFPQDRVYALENAVRWAEHHGSVDCASYLKTMLDEARQSLTDGVIWA